MKTGFNHSLFIDSSHKVWSCGNNHNGRLGLPTAGVQVPTEVPLLPPIIDISAGVHSLFLDESGAPWGCGDNQDGALGLGTVKKDVFAPDMIFIPTKIRAISAGNFHSLFLDETGVVWGCGVNKSGELGFPDRENRHQPEKINLIKTIVEIGAGAHSSFRDNKGRIWCCGQNNRGQLGLGDKNLKDQVVPKKVKNLPKIKAMSISGHCLYIDKKGCVWSCGSNAKGQLGLGDCVDRFSPEKVKSLSLIQAVSAGYGHSIFLGADGSVQVCGNNQYGQLGTGNNDFRKFETTILQLEYLPPITAICAERARHSLLCDYEGVVWCAGCNVYGQLGLDTREESKLFVKITSLPPVAIGYQKPTKSARST